MLHARVREHSSLKKCDAVQSTSRISLVRCHEAEEATPIVRE